MRGGVCGLSQVKVSVKWSAQDAFIIAFPIGKAIPALECWRCPHLDSLSLITVVPTPSASDILLPARCTLCTSLCLQHPSALAVALALARIKSAQLMPVQHFH